MSHLRSADVLHMLEAMSGTSGGCTHPNGAKWYVSAPPKNVVAHVQGVQRIAACRAEPRLPDDSLTVDTWFTLVHCLVRLHACANMPHVWVHGVAHTEQFLTTTDITIRWAK